MTYKLGCIADDFTGATDLALQIKQGGYSVIQTVGVPTAELIEPADAVVVALKSRTNAAAEAVQQSLDALAFLKGLGVEQFLFKYCSTFDSTADGNIVPVADALMQQIGAELAIVCPAFPRNGRTVYMGKLFVFDQLLSESPMKDHPLTPMRDADLVRLLSAQTIHPVGRLVTLQIEQGATAIHKAFDDLVEHGVRYAVVDAVNDAHLQTLGEAVVHHAFITGGSAIAAPLVRARRARDHAGSLVGQQVKLPLGDGVVLAGSCSAATLEQIRVARQSMPAIKLDLDAIANNAFNVDDILGWAAPHLSRGPVLIYAGESAAERAAHPFSVVAVDLGANIERAMAELVNKLVDVGVRRLVVAGGETSGAVVKALGIDYLTIAEEIDPGVPWTVSNSRHGKPALGLALKSGNFGAADFFTKAFEVSA